MDRGVRRQPRGWLVTRTNTLVARAAAAGVLAVAVCCASVPAFAQSLGEVARKQAERRKTITGPVTVITNDHLKPVPAVPAKAAGEAGQPDVPEAGAPPDAGAPPETGAPEQPPPPPDPTKDQEHWRRRMTDAIQQRDRNRFLMEAVQSRINALTTDFYARDDPFQRAKIGEERQRTIEELARMKLEQEKLEQKIADIVEEARRANVPPGWLR